MAKPRITHTNESMSVFEGDAIIIPSDLELANTKAGEPVRWLIQKANSSLIKEITSIGYCEIGNAVITQGYNIGVKHIIFMPYQDLNNQTKADFVLLHQAFRSAFTLASLYKVKTMGMPTFQLKAKESPIVTRLSKINAVDSLLDRTKFKDNEIEDILASVISEFESTSIEKLVLYK